MASRGLQVRGLRRGSSQKQSNAFAGSEALKSSSGRDLFPNNKIIPQKPKSNYRDKVHVEGTNAFSSNRGGTVLGSESSKFNRSTSFTPTNTQQDFLIEPSPNKLIAKQKSTSSQVAGGTGGTTTPTSIFSPLESSKMSRNLTRHDEVLNDFSVPPPFEQQRGGMVSPTAAQSSTGYEKASTSSANNLAQQPSSPQHKSKQKQAPNSETIIIHVCDEARGVNRDFPCDRRTLLAEMRYFRAYLANDDGSRKGEDVDISVHCDVNIFEWLVEFMQSPNSPLLDTSSVVSILISAEFLEMEKLVNHCLNFMAAQLEEIIKMPIDLSCIPDRLVQKLADRVDATLLGGLRDKRDKLLSKLYKRRLELDFRNPPLDARRGGGMSKICCCKWCGRLFHFASANLVMCDRAPVSVDFRGNVVARHRTLSEWSLTECVSRLHRNGMSWGDIYWLLWGTSHVFYCTITRSAFPASELSRRRIHPLPPTLDSSTGTLVHACCDTPKLQFDVTGAGQGSSVCDGCSFADHHVDDDRGAVCFIGTVRRLHNIPAHSDVEDKDPMSPQRDSSTGMVKSSPATPDARKSPRGVLKTSSSPRSSAQSSDANGYVTARRLLECQRDQLVASSQHPAMQQEIVGILRGRVAESLLLRPPSPDSGNKNGETSSTDKTVDGATPSKKPSTQPQKSSRKSNTPSTGALVGSTLKGGKIVTNRKSMTAEEIAVERLEIENMVNNLDSLGFRDHHAVFRSIPPIDDTVEESDANRILQPHEHPFTLIPEECLRDLEMISNLFNSNKLTQVKKQAWEVDLIREQDAKRMVLLSRLAHQARLPLPPPPPELVSKSHSNGNGNFNRKKERDSTNMSKRWR